MDSFDTKANRASRKDAPTPAERQDSARADEKAGKKDPLSPSQRRIFEDGLERFDTLYRKLAE